MMPSMATQRAPYSIVPRKGEDRPPTNSCWLAASHSNRPHSVRVAGLGRSMSDLFLRRSTSARLCEHLVADDREIVFDALAVLDR